MDTVMLENCITPGGLSDRTKILPEHELDEKLCRFV